MMTIKQLCCRYLLWSLIFWLPTVTYLIYTRLEGGSYQPPSTQTISAWEILLNNAMIALVMLVVGYIHRGLSLAIYLLNALYLLVAVAIAREDHQLTLVLMRLIWHGCIEVLGFAMMLVASYERQNMTDKQYMTSIIMSLLLLTLAAYIERSTL